MSPPRPTSPLLALSSPSRPATRATSTSSTATLVSPCPSSRPSTMPKSTVLLLLSSFLAPADALELCLRVSLVLRFGDDLGRRITRAIRKLTHSTFLFSLLQPSRPSPPSLSSPRSPAPATPRPSTLLTLPARPSSMVSSSTVDPPSPSRFSLDLMVLTASTSPRTSMACEYCRS
jgi:hypothetical protein